MFFSNQPQNSRKSPEKSRKSKFTPDEDSKLIQLVNQFGENKWSLIVSFMDGRNVRQCRERWRHYLSPSISKAPWTMMEDYLLDQKYAEFGPKWKKIAEFFPNRTDINIKNRFLLKQRRMERLTSQIAEISAEFSAKKKLNRKESKKHVDQDKRSNFQEQNRFINDLDKDDERNQDPDDIIFEEFDSLFWENDHESYNLQFAE